MGAPLFCNQTGCPRQGQDSTNKQPLAIFHFCLSVTSQSSLSRTGANDFNLGSGSLSPVLLTSSLPLPFYQKDPLKLFVQWVAAASRAPIFSSHSLDTDDNCCPPAITSTAFRFDIGIRCKKNRKYQPSYQISGSSLPCVSISLGAT